MREADGNFLKLLLELLQGSVNTIMFFTAGETLGTYLTDKIKLYRASKYEGVPIKECTFIKDIPASKEIKWQQKDLNDLLPLVEKLLNYTAESNLENMYANLNSLKIKKKFFSLIDGSYNPRTNKIEYFRKSSLGHEILHLASSYYDSETKIYYAGFEQRNKEFGIGKALNEGYTELLASRIYNKDNRVEAYKFQTRIAELIELFFDDPKEMESFYFNHDLFGFAKYMEKYVSSKELVKLLIEMDNDYFHAIRIIFNPFALYDSVKIQLKLYELFKKTNPDPEKMKKFENIISENKIIRMILNKNKMKIHRENQPIPNKKLSIEEEFKKLH